ncbi:Putative EKC/KEOPS complex, subunit Gon7 protein [Septoria linicola]|uniref:EKC/KEOPS complex subunit GON7 n=1 Tax=Septoria linicola TaxID=215465 RepID=A0A9Q9AEE3_9PEZI|nr:putative EKC/KEOPS complex, subunit Gon7 protein [Septoria linicola]USW47585.1 Putative EKC/KEOPS complex, subunit Gon7 protein [Septoria linicola]
MTSTPLTASYKSPTAAQNFALELPQLPRSDGVDEKTTYLGSLRASASKLQGELNTFLTQKMEQDKAAEAGKGNSHTTNEDREEDMYGEEDAENDA